VSVVLTPTTRSQRDRLLRMGLLFFLAALPVGLVLVLLVNWPIAIGYVVVQTAGLLFGVRQQHTAALKLDAKGVQFEPGNFVLRAEWSDIDRVEEVTLPSGPTQALVLKRSGLRWTHTPQVRAEVTRRGWDVLIPLDEFESDWRNGRVGEALREHRPDLLQP
jgi:hypothetical protein